MTYNIKLTTVVRVEEISAIYTEDISYWSTQVPERGDFINYWCQPLEKDVKLTVESRTWEPVAVRKGGSQGTHDVYVMARGETSL